MMQLVDKNIIVEAIKKRLESHHPTEITSGRYALTELLEFLDTLETKNVDLEREIWKFIVRYLPKKKKKNHASQFTQDDITDVAMYFFGLGLRIGKE